MSRIELFGLEQPPDFQVGFETYLSPNSQRYGSPEMRSNWSELRKLRLMQDFWIATAEVQAEAGIVTQEQVDDLRLHRDEVRVERVLQFERHPVYGTGHDVAATIAAYAEVAPIGGEILHQGETSEEPLGTAETIQILNGFEILGPKVDALLRAYRDRISQHKDLAAMGFTHLQIAEPVTYGYRFAKYAQDLMMDKAFVDYVKSNIKAKGVKGPVGTSAALEELLEGTGMTPEEHEQRIMEKMGLDYVTVSDQTYPRKMLFLTEAALASIGQTLHRYTMDLQLLSSAFIMEVSEPYRKGQVGSSAMPHKKNPINSENIGSVTEALPGHLVSAWQTGAFVTLERTLRDSAGKRSWLPESFLAVDESLMRAERITRGLIVREPVIAANLRKYAPFAATESILAKLGRSGMDRNDAHEILVGISEMALEAVGSGEPNPMRNLVLADNRIVAAIGEAEIEASFEEILTHIGNASRRCDDFLREELNPILSAS